MGGCRCCWCPGQDGFEFVAEETSPVVDGMELSRDLYFAEIVGGGEEAREHHLPIRSTMRRAGEQSTRLCSSSVVAKMNPLRALCRPIVATRFAVSSQSSRCLATAVSDSSSIPPNLIFEDGDFDVTDEVMRMLERDEGELGAPFDTISSK